MKIWQKTLLSLVVLGGVSFGTVNTVSASYSSQDTGLKRLSYAKAKKTWGQKHVYKLAFFENESSDNDRQYWLLGVYNHKNHLKHITLDSDGNNWQEIVDPDLKTPYAVITDDGIAIHRPPYSMFNQPEVSGTVTDKEGTGSW